MRTFVNDQNLCPCPSRIGLLVFPDFIDQHVDRFCTKADARERVDRNTSDIASQYLYGGVSNVESTHLATVPVEAVIAIASEELGHFFFNVLIISRKSTDFPVPAKLRVKQRALCMR